MAVPAGNASYLFVPFDVSVPATAIVSAAGRQNPRLGSEANDIPGAPDVPSAALNWPLIPASPFLGREPVISEPISVKFWFTFALSIVVFDEKLLGTE
jgi:hypothetical protein